MRPHILKQDFVFVTYFVELCTFKMPSVSINAQAHGNLFFIQGNGAFFYFAGCRLLSGLTPVKVRKEVGKSD